MPETRVMREQKVLRCYLTRDEKLERGQRVAELTYTIDGLEAEKKAEADRYKGKISEAEDMRKRLSGVLRDGYEMRPVECRLEFHYNLGRVWTIREDTGELIDDREMKGEERFRQGRLFPEGEKPPRSPESIGREALERGGPTILPAEEPAPDSGSVNQNPPQPDTPAQGVGEADDPNIAHTEEQEEAAGDPTSAGEAASSEAREEQTCATCNHSERVHGTDEHGDQTGCMAIDCRCRRFVQRDLLGVDDWDPQAQEGGEPCDSAS